MAIMVCTTVYSFLQPIEKIGEWWFVKSNSIFGKRKARQTFVYEPFFRGIAEVCFVYKQVMRHAIENLENSIIKNN